MYVNGIYSFFFLKGGVGVGVGSNMKLETEVSGMCLDVHVFIHGNSTFPLMSPQNIAQFNSKYINMI